MIERFDTHGFDNTVNQHPSRWIIVGLFNLLGPRHRAWRRHRRHLAGSDGFSGQSPDFTDREPSLGKATEARLPRPRVLRQQTVLRPSENLEMDEAGAE